MATTARARHRLYQRLSEVIGSDETDTLMELLPPTGWADIATKHDLARQTALSNARFDALDARFDRLENIVHTTTQVLDSRISTEIAGVRTEKRVPRRIDTSDRGTDRLGHELHDEPQIPSRLADEFADLRSEIRRAVWQHTLVTIGVLGPYIIMVGIVTS